MRKIIHPEFPDYFVLEDGTVERRNDGAHGRKAGSILSGRVLKSGYRQFKLCHRDGDQRLVRANRLVCEAFHGPPPTSVHQAAHKNGINLDNRESNLYWATPKENKQDSIRHGTYAHGGRASNQHGRAKLSEDKVIKIRANYSGTRGEIRRLAIEFGVGLTAIKNVLEGKTWFHVPGRSALDRRKGAAR